MTPFPITILPGQPISDQIVYAAKRAIISGQLRHGDPFPSVRTLSKELRINPNTAHKAVVELVDAGLLSMHPGKGTVVEVPVSVNPKERAKLLRHRIEELVVEACWFGVDRNELIRSIEEQYERLTPKSQTGIRR